MESKDGGDDCWSHSSFKTTSQSEELGMRSEEWR